MISTLIIYSSTDGQTIKICKEIASRIKEHNHVQVVYLNEATQLDIN